MTQSYHPSNNKFMPGSVSPKNQQPRKLEEEKPQQKKSFREVLKMRVNPIGRDAIRKQYDDEVAANMQEHLDRVTPSHLIPEKQSTDPVAPDTKRYTITKISEAHLRVVQRDVFLQYVPHEVYSRHPIRWS